MTDSLEKRVAVLERDMRAMQSRLDSAEPRTPILATPFNRPLATMAWDLRDPHQRRGGRNDRPVCGFEL